MALVTRSKNDYAGTHTLEVVWTVVHISKLSHPISLPQCNSTGCSNRRRPGASDTLRLSVSCARDCAGYMGFGLTRPLMTHTHTHSHLAFGGRAWKPRTGRPGRRTGAKCTSPKSSTGPVAGRFHHFAAWWGCAAKLPPSSVDEAFARPLRCQGCHAHTLLQQPAPERG